MIFFHTTAGVSNSKWFVGRMRLKERSRGPLGNKKKLDYVLKINLFGKISKLNLCFLKNLHFFWCSRAALDPLAGRIGPSRGPHWTHSRAALDPLNRDTFVSNLYCRRQNWFNTIYLIYSSGYLILKGFKNKLDGRFNSHSFCLFIAISFYLFISILCAKILCLTWALT